MAVLAFNELNIVKITKLSISFRSSRPELPQELQRRCFPINIFEILKNNYFHRTPLVAASSVLNAIVSDIVNTSENVYFKDGR